MVRNGVRDMQQEQAQTVVHKFENQKHGVPAILSFFLPGLGQLIKGEIAKGVIIFIGFWVAIITVVGVIVAIPLWLWGIVDAYNHN